MPSITGDGFDLPVSKRQRIIQPQLLAQEKESQSRIFSHFRVGVFEHEHYDNLLTSYFLN